MTRLTAKTALCLLLLAPIGLSGCSSMDRAFDREAREGNPAPCPNVIVLQDAARMVSFDGEASLENVTYTGEITNVSTSCRYYGDAPIEADVDIDFAFGRGPKADSGNYSVNYFVAVTRTDRDVIEKEVFTLPVRFSGNRTTVNLSDSINKITIPRKDASTSGINFEIVVGLALTREQVLFNRSGKSLRFPDLD